MRDVREALRLEEALDLDGSGHADAREVVPPEVDEHHVLGPVLLRGEQALGVTVAGSGRAGDRVQARLPVGSLDERLRRGADEREVVQLEQEQVRRRIDPPQRPVQLERGGRRRPLGALREHDLERVARADVPLRPLDAALVLEPPGRAPSATAVPVPAHLGERCAAGRRAARRSRPRRRTRRLRDPSRGRTGRARRRSRTGSRGGPARRQAAAPSARAAPRSRRRGSRRPARHTPRPPRSRPAASRSRRRSAFPAGRARRTRGGTTPRPRDAAASTRRGGSRGLWL